MASYLDHDPDALAAVARAVPGVVPIFTQAIKDALDVDLQVALDGRHYCVFVTVHDAETLIKDVTVTLDGGALDERTKLVLLRMAARAMLERQARFERRWEARTAAIRASKRTMR